MENKRKTWRTEQNQNDISNQKSNRLILDNESSEESDEGERGGGGGGQDVMIFNVKQHYRS